MQMWWAGLGEEMSQTDGAAGGRGGEGVQKTIIAVMNESGGRSPRAVTLSLRRDPVAPELHYHDTVTSTLSFGWEREHDWGSRAGTCRAGWGSVARHRQRRLLGSHPAAGAPSGNLFSSGTTDTLRYAPLLTAHRHCLLWIKLLCYSVV